jgi:hypothetical protein
MQRNNKRVQDVTDEEREAYLESIWERGGFQFALMNYNNVVLDPEANKVSTNTRQLEVE